MLDLYYMANFHYSLITFLKNLLGLHETHGIEFLKIHHLVLFDTCPNELDDVHDETTCNLLKRHKTKKPLQNNGFKGNETI